MIITYIHTSQTGWRQELAQIDSKRERDESTAKDPVKKRKGDCKDDKVNQRTTPADYQTARVAYANCPCAVFGFWGATAKELGAADAIAFTGFASVVADP